MFAKDTYVHRRERLKQQLQSGIVLILGNDESPMNYPDNPYEFRQDSSFLYFFGLDSPGLVGVIDIDVTEQRKAEVPAVRVADRLATHVERAVRANVGVSVDHLQRGSEILEQLIQNEGLRVVGAEYSLETGEVDFFDCAQVE